MIKLWSYLDCGSPDQGSNPSNDIFFKLKTTHTLCQRRLWYSSIKEITSQWNRVWTEYKVIRESKWSFGSASGLNRLIKGFSMTQVMRAIFYFMALLESALDYDISSYPGVAGECYSSVLRHYYNKVQLLYRAAENQKYPLVSISLGNDFSIGHLWRLPRHPQQQQLREDPNPDLL